MLRRVTFLALLMLPVLVGLSACAPQPGFSDSGKGALVADYWRPISWPNVTLAPDKAQLKLNYDLQQCQCANFPRNLPTPVNVEFNPDIARLTETGVTNQDTGQGCASQPGLVLTECMRARGWEKTDCAGRPNPPAGTQLCG